MEVGQRSASSSEHGEVSDTDPSEPHAVLDGREFRGRVLRPDGSVDQAAFRKLWGPLRVLARCTPSDKLTIVKGTRPLSGSPR